MDDACPRPPLSVALLLGDRFDDLDFFPLFALLVKAADYAPIRAERWSWRPEATSKCGIRVSCHCGEIPPEGFDAVVVPGAADFSELAANPAVLQLLSGHAALGRPAYTVCSGIDLLERSGLVDGFTVCAHWRRAGTAGTVTYSGTGIERDRWLTSIGGDGSNRYSKSVECFFRILEDHFPDARDAIVARTEIDSAFPATRGAGTTRTEIQT